MINFIRWLLLFISAPEHLTSEDIKNEKERFDVNLLEEDVKNFKKKYMYASKDYCQKRVNKFHYFDVIKIRNHKWVCGEYIKITARCVFCEHEILIFYPLSSKNIDEAMSFWKRIIDQDSVMPAAEIKNE